jgi:hypothetical protein
MSADDMLLYVVLHVSFDGYLFGWFRYLLLCS